MMYHIFLVISIGVAVSGLNESKYATFLDGDVNRLIEINSRILKENENFKHQIYTLANKNVELERRVNFIEQNIAVSNNYRKKHGFHSNIQVHLNENLTEINGKGYPFTSKINHPMLMSKNMNDNNHTKDKRQVTRRSSGGAIFHARVLPTLQNLGDNQEIPFKDIHIDTHSAFHGDSGIYTTAVAGYYAIFATIVTYPDIKLEFSIVSNGKWVCLGRSKAINEFGTGSTSGIVYLDVGDKLWAKVLSGGHSGSGNMVLSDYSSFVGFHL